MNGLMDKWIVGLTPRRADDESSSFTGSAINLLIQPSLNSPASRRGGRVVYCGGLENRFGFTADGGSNPSLSAKPDKAGTRVFGATNFLVDCGMAGGTRVPFPVSPSIQ
jgi:hypothetical protein